MAIRHQSGGSPGTAVGINWSSPQAVGLVCVWPFIGSNLSRELVTGAPTGVVNGTIPRGASSLDGVPVATWATDGGAGDYVILGAAPASLQGTAHASLSCWTYRATATRNGFGWAEDASAYNHFCILTWDNGFSYAKLNSSGGTVNTFTNFADSATGWHHYFLDYDGTQSGADFGVARIRFYKDGVLQTTAGSGVGATFTTSFGNATIGRLNDAGSTFSFTGMVVDARLYQRQQFFSSSEVLDLYRQNTRFQLYRQPSQRVSVDIGAAAPGGGTWPGAFINAGYY